MEVRQNRELSWSSTDSHPSDKNKDVRWMGHSFIRRGSAKAGGRLLRNSDSSANPTRLRCVLRVVGHSMSMAERLHVRHMSDIVRIGIFRRIVTCEEYRQVTCERPFRLPAVWPLHWIHRPFSGTRGAAVHLRRVSGYSLQLWFTSWVCEGKLFT
jgi:hypothetical protein